MTDLLDIAETEVGRGTHTPDCEKNLTSGNLASGNLTSGKAAAAAVVQGDGAYSLFSALIPEELPERRGAGRPAGSPNKRTTDFVKLCREVSGGRDPLVGAFRIATAPLTELVGEFRKIAQEHGIPMGGTVLDVAKLQSTARAEVMPYVHAKRLAVNEQGDELLPVMMMGVLKQTHQGTVDGAINLDDMIEMYDADGNIITNKINDLDESGNEVQS